jgi:hypothetical protein
MPLYEVIVTTPFRDPTLDYEFENLLIELEPLGLTNAEMAPIGYIFEIFSALDKRDLAKQVRQVIDYYGLAIGSIDDLGF